MKTHAHYPFLLLALVSAGCAVDAGSAEEDITSVSEAYRVDDPNLVCGSPNPNQGELLATSGSGAVLQEWSDSINAMPSGATKTDLLNRLLTALEGPATAYPVVSDQTTFLRNVRAPLPMSYPYGQQATGAQVSDTPLSGWFYDPGLGSHRGIDFNRASVNGSDPSFDVLAVADGKVIGVYFDGPRGGGGNTVVIEHTGANGKKIYSFYMHLRGGATHDANAVKNIDCSLDGDPTGCSYYKIAANKVPLAAWWGTESDNIVVTPGQDVKRGQKIARSGSTMTAIGKLDSSGNAVAGNPWANHHLHIYIGAPMPAPNDKIAVEVDPFGVYQDYNSGCYVRDFSTETDQPTYYSRLFAPFLPDFYNLGWTLFTSYPDYLGGMNYAPATLSFYDNSGFKVTGSYQYSTQGYILQVGAAGSVIDPYVGGNKTNVPRETRVRIDGAGNPIYDFIATPRQSGESTVFWRQLSQASFDSMYQAYIVSGGYKIGDFFPYKVAGTQYYAAMFTTSAAASNWMTYSKTAAQITSDVAAIPAGLQVAQIIADTTWSPPKFSMIARPSSGCAPHKYIDQSTTIYQSKLDAETALGYTLQKVQVYGTGGSKFNAVFWKSASPCAAQP